jgi:hypothetical protein
MSDEEEKIKKRNIEEELEVLFKEFSEEITITRINIVSKAMEVPLLHNKYKKMLSLEKMHFAKVDTGYQKLKKLKFDYYNGTLDMATINQRGWSPIRETILKANIPMYMEADQELRSATNYIASLKEKIECIESILQQLRNISYLLTTASNMIIFEGGG